MQKCKVKFVGHTPRNDVIVTESIIDSNEDFDGTEEEFVDVMQAQLNRFLSTEGVDFITVGSMRVNIKEYAALQFHVSKYVENTVNMRRKIS